MLTSVQEYKSNSQNPEQDLIRVCNGLENANRELHDLFSSQIEARSPGLLASNHARWEELAARAASIPAHTLDGVRARVRALGREFVSDILRAADLADDAEREMIEALIRDLTAEA